ncbi:PAS domain S-box protein [Candidatus Dojkabacteria bacterium]|uniref:histidine kinase n=1 Tax=Candidatus Dojkabacteria bacterium TaxID=2099670 RepID=A0A955L7C5_9BACT|nr:PAS domain S-box protein [Candidatus Dojkabacteria bacterium]
MTRKSELKKSLEDFFYSGEMRTYETDRTQRLALVNTFLTVGLFGLLYLGIANILREGYWQGIVEVSAALVSMVSIVLLRKTKEIETIAFIETAKIFVIVLYLFITGSVGNTGLLWQPFFPIVAFGLNRRRNGVIWIFTYFVAMATMWVLNTNLNLWTSYSTIQLSRTMLGVVFMTFFIYIYESIMSEDLKYIRTKNNQLSKANKELRGHIDKVDEAKKELKHVVKELKDKNKQLEEIKSAMLNVLEDIEDEKEFTAEERNKLETIIESIGDAVFVVDSNRNIILVNNITEEMTQYSKRDLIGKKYSKHLRFLHEKDDTDASSFIEEVFELGNVISMPEDTVLVRKDGTKLAVNDSASPVFSESGDIIGCVVVFRDTSQEREIDRMKSEFVSVASHQLKTPLTGIKWVVESLLDDKSELTDENKALVLEIFKSNERMIDLVNDLLNVSRIESGDKFILDAKENDIISIIKQVIKDQSAFAAKENVIITLDEDIPEALVVSVDKDKILQLFNNLISNAVKYAKDEGSVKVGVDNTHEKNIVITVQDDGIGIPRNQRKRIFEKFFRADNVYKSESEGTGLGLYISRAIAEAHGGDIWFKSNEDKGSIFYISLPKILAVKKENK